MVLFSSSEIQTFFGRRCSWFDTPCALKSRLSAMASRGGQSQTSSEKNWMCLEMCWIPQNGGVFFVVGWDCLKLKTLPHTSGCFLFASSWQMGMAPRNQAAVGA